MGILHVVNRKNGGKPYTSGVWERARGNKNMVAKETRKLTSPKYETSRDTVTPTYETFMKPPVNLLRTVLILSRFQCLLRILDSSNKHIAIWSLGTSNTYAKKLRCSIFDPKPQLHVHQSSASSFHWGSKHGLPLERAFRTKAKGCVCVYVYIYVCVSTSMMIVDLVFRPDSGYHPHHPIPKPASPL